MSADLLKLTCLFKLVSLPNKNNLKLFYILPILSP